MKVKAVIPREQANLDIDETISWYLAEGEPQAALDFVAALEKGFGHISRHAATGSPRYAHELNLPGLRVWSLSRYPHLVFYVERNDHVDVWRVLHGMRDLPAWLQESDML